MGIQQVIAGLRNFVGSQFSTITYSQSSVYALNAAATETVMNDGSADGSASSAQSGTNSAAGSYFKADLGSSKYVSHVVIGYDYLSNLPGGWGTSYTAGKLVQVSDDDATYTTVNTTPTYNATGMSTGLVKVLVQRNARYIKITEPNTNYSAIIEFQIWGF